MVEDIHIGEEVVVLLLSLDEGVLDFKDVSEASRFLDGGEGLINDLHVALIVVDQFYLFFVVHDQLGESLLEHGCSVVLDGVDLSRLDA